MAASGITIGLDIDEKSVKFVKLKQTNGEVSLLKYAVREVPQAEDKVKSISDILKELFKDEKSEAQVYTSAFGTNVSLKRITIPVMPDEEIVDAIKWEAKNLVPFPLENSIIDYYKIGKFTDKAAEKYDIMFAVAGEELVNMFNAISKESGVKFSGISLVPLALANLLSLNNKMEKDKVNAIIDIGSEAASINLFKGDLLHFTREITVAGDSLTKAMTGLLVADHWQLNLTYEQAEEIKKTHGIPKKDTSEVTESGIPLIHIYEMMAPTLRRLQNEILRSFDYYKEEFREEKVDNIFLMGGSSKLGNLEEFLSNALGVKVETIDALANLKIDPSSGIKEEEARDLAPRLALSIGLALEKGKKINLFRAKEKQRAAGLNLEELFKKVPIKVPVKILANAAVWGGVSVVALAMIYNVYLANVRNHYKKEIATKQQILTEVKALIEKRSVLQQIAREETRVKETLSQISLALPTGIELTDLVYDNGKRQVWISGDAKDTKTVGKLLKNFEDSSNFKRTTLQEARKTVIEGVNRILFKVTFFLT